MNPKSGTGGNTVVPIEPKDPFEADNADPGKVAVQRKQEAKVGQGKYGAQRSEPHRGTSAVARRPQSDATTSPFSPYSTSRPPLNTVANTSQSEPESTWIEIELLDEADQPVPGERYEITLPDGSVATGTLDEKGFARVDGIAEPGDCQVTFPRLDKDAWEVWTSKKAEAESPSVDAATETTRADALGPPAAAEIDSTAEPTRVDRSRRSSLRPSNDDPEATRVSLGNRDSTASTDPELTRVSLGDRFKKQPADNDRTRVRRGSRAKTPPNDPEYTRLRPPGQRPKNPDADDSEA